ncbi:hypothetical protein Ahy_A08g040087 [Arachis hypogaea]|uniref:Uncharacterized protein n=1 Tax=Arachis hypogaea TaxID=3818 RepID=A0A445BYS3_ARAHY|nr:hypothetical protein Ahy_A08g040087 [Arachis hypogaea]
MGLVPFWRKKGEEVVAAFGERNRMSNILVFASCVFGLTASLSATAIAGERPPPTTSQPPPPSSQRNPSTAPTQDLLADRAAQHCSTQPAPSAQQVGTTLASRTHHHPQSLATRKSHPAGQDQPLTQDHPADTEHRIKSDMEPEPPSQVYLRDDKQFFQDHLGAVPITTVQGEELRKLIGAPVYIECSSKTQQNVKAVFDAAIKVVLQPPKQKKKKRKGQKTCSIL